MPDPFQSQFLDLPLLAQGQAQKHITHNDAIDALDMIVHLTVEDVVTELPISPQLHMRVRLAADIPPGRIDDILVFQETGWHAITPKPGWRCWNLSDQELNVFSGSEWQTLSDKQVSQFGINATPDAVNRLTLRSEAVLFNHDGGGHQLKINKASDEQTASILFQSNHEGQAEIGLAANRDFSVKVNANGTWMSAMSIDGMTGDVDIHSNLKVDGSSVLGQDDPDAMRTRDNIPTGEDLNTYTQTGFYFQTSNAWATSGSNYPIMQAGLLQVVGNAVFTYQTYTDFGGNQVFVRVRYSTSWSPWRSLVN